MKASWRNSFKYYLKIMFQESDIMVWVTILRKKIGVNTSISESYLDSPVVPVEFFKSLISQRRQWNIVCLCLLKNYN